MEEAPSREGARQNALRSYGLEDRPTQDTVRGNMDTVFVDLTADSLGAILGKDSKPLFGNIGWCLVS